MHRTEQALPRNHPALGIRGVRVGWQRPEVLRTQLDAIGLAAQGIFADLFAALGNSS